jgi:predicted O-methyltransferase YrrM
MPKAFQHFLKFLLNIEKAETQTTQAERNCIAKFAKGKKRCVEIGVFEGVTTGTIASVLDADAVLYGVDPFFAGRLGICWGLPIAKRQIAKSHAQCRVELIRMLSCPASKHLHGQFDFIFIDGDHSLKGIQQDWHDWSVRVDDGGIIGLHDTVVPAHNPRVASLGSHQYFVSNIQHDPRFELLEQVDSLSILRRNALR